MYDVVFVEPGPLPPHERSWRHPSELGPTRVEVDDSNRHSHAGLLALGGGIAAVLAVAAMVVAMTPRTSNGPVALGATTTPITARAVIEAPTTTEATAPTQSVAPGTALLTSFAAVPHAVTSGPQFVLDGAAVADEAPADDDLVYLRTDAVTYHLHWDDARQLGVPDGSVVFDADGDLVAHVSAGQLVSLVDD